MPETTDDAAALDDFNAGWGADDLAPGCDGNASADLSADDAPAEQTAEEVDGQQAARAFVKVRDADFDGAATILEAHPHLWTKREAEGHTFLHWGALSGNAGFIAKALAAGLPVDVPCDNQQTPLMWAFIRGHTAAAHQLLEAGANIRARDSFGACPLILAIQHHQHPAMLQILSRDDRQKILRDVDCNRCGPVHWAAYKGDLTSLKLLDYFDADFSAVDNSKMTPLHRAAQTSQSAVCEILLEKGVDPSLLDSEGRTCLDVASKDEIFRRRLNAYLDDFGASVQGSVRPDDLEMQPMTIGSPDDSTSAPRRKRKKRVPEEHGLFKGKAVHNLAPTFWLVMVSLAVFEYLTDLRDAAWAVSPYCAFFFELGVPASLFLFFFVALSDPGKIQPRPKNASGVEEYVRALTQWHAAPAENKEPDFGRLCTSTWILKGLRTKYCTQTLACVEEFDHFCGWLNIAIGKGNHRPFIVLAGVECTTQLCHLFLCWTCSVALVKIPTFSDWFFAVSAAYPLLLVMAIVHCFTGPGILMLFLSQLRLVIVNMTTNEMINSYRYSHFWQEIELGGAKKKVFHNPFNKGSGWANCIDFWWNRKRGERGPEQPPGTKLRLC